MKVDLAHKVALVTGAARGIGQAIADLFAANGARGVYSDLDFPAAGEAAARSPGCKAAALDVTDADQVEAVVGAVARDFGRLDILVNNAGRALGKQPHEFPMAEWRAVTDANLTSVVICSQAAHPEMKRAGGAKIVHAASLAAVLAMPTMAAYAPSKAGVVQFSRVCAAAWARDNIQVNAVLPGWIETDMTRPRREDPAFNERVLARVPAGRWGTPDDLAGIAAFLAGPASDFITGTAIPVDGGYSFAV